MKNKSYLWFGLVVPALWGGIAVFQKTRKNGITEKKNLSESELAKSNLSTDGISRNKSLQSENTAEAIKKRGTKRAAEQDKSSIKNKNDQKKIYTGAKGGKYYLNEKGGKVYLKK